MRTLLLAALLLVIGIAVCPAQPEGDGSGITIDVAPLRNPSTADNEDLPNPDDFIPVEQEVAYSENDLQKRVRYPQAAREQEIEGKVLVRALVMNDGRVTRVLIDQSSNKILERAAVEAVRETPFTPAIQNNKPIATWKQVVVRFRLDPPSHSIGTEEIADTEVSMQIDLDIAYDEHDLQSHIHYPPKALEQHVEGRVILQVVVTKDGSVGQVVVLKSDNTLLNDAAIEAVKQTTFTPGKNHRFPTDAWTIVPVNFKID